MLKITLAVVMAVAATLAGAQTKVESFPAALAAGHWVSDVRMNSSSKKAPASDYWWVGRMWGRIDATGKMDFQSANGCVVSGLLSKRFGTYLKGTAEIKNCPGASMNRIYTVTAKGAGIDGRGSDMHLTLDAYQFQTSISAASGRFTVEGAFVRYQP